MKHDQVASVHMLVQGMLWVCREAGWWTSAGVGGVCLEPDRKWYFYPLNDSKRFGPFSTLAETLQKVVIWNTV